MRDATYVLLALAMCCGVAVFHQLIQTQIVDRRQSIMDLKEFHGLPYELRNTLRKTLPDPGVVRQQWAKMTPDQKRMVIQQMTHLLPHAPPPPPPSPKGLKRGFLLNKNQKKDSKNKEKDEVGALSLTGNSNVLAANDSFLGTDE
jgi:hypothetical protein